MGKLIAILSQQNWVNGDTYYLVLNDGEDIDKLQDQYNKTDLEEIEYMSFGDWLLKNKYAVKATEQEITIIYELI